MKLIVLHRQFLELAPTLLKILLESKPPQVLARETTAHVLGYSIPHLLVHVTFSVCRECNVIIRP